MSRVELQHKHTKEVHQFYRTVMSEWIRERDSKRFAPPMISKYYEPVIEHIDTYRVCVGVCGKRKPPSAYYAERFKQCKRCMCATARAKSRVKRRQGKLL